MRMRPAPEDLVHVVNSFYERRPDGCWRAWVEPLGGDEPRQRLFETVGADADDARAGLALAQLRHLESLEPTARADWYAVHAVQVEARRTGGDRPWPPPSGYCRNLDIIEPA